MLRAETLTSLSCCRLATSPLFSPDEDDEGVGSESGTYNERRNPGALHAPVGHRKQHENMPRKMMASNKNNLATDGDHLVDLFVLQKNTLNVGVCPWIDLGKKTTTSALLYFVFKVPCVVSLSR